MATRTWLSCGRKMGSIWTGNVFALLNPQKYSSSVVQTQNYVERFFLLGHRSLASDSNVDVETDRTADRSVTNKNDLKSNSKNKGLPQTRLLKVAIIGEANSGKSTLTNCLIGDKISAVTAVPHTTRRQTTGVFALGDAQIVLLDTPGIVNIPTARRLKMTREHMRAPSDALHDADIIAVLIDAADRKRSMVIPETILTNLENHTDLPSVLILNKIDVVKVKTRLLDIATVLVHDREKDEWGYKDEGGWSGFEHVFMVSARTGDGIDDLKKYFAVKAKPADWLFPADTATDQNFEQIMHEIFREKILQLYEHEIPWQIRQVGC